MTVQSLTYAELAEVWGVSKDAARKKVEGLRLPRKLGNDGKTRVTIDLNEVRHSPKPIKSETGHAPEGDRQETGRPPSSEVLVLRAMVETLKADLERERTSLEREQQERRNEKERADRLSTDLIRMAQAFAEAQAEAAKGRVEARRADDAAADRDAWCALAQRPWWKRLAG